MIAVTNADSGYVVGWGSLALINAGLAQSKGQSGLFWFVLSLFIGPLATFIIVVFARPPEAPKDRDA
jgi:hypothetical protein